MPNTAFLNWINPTIAATYLLGSTCSVLISEETSDRAVRFFIAHQQKDERPRADERRKGTRELLGE